jgi:hypothetical protein
MAFRSVGINLQHLYLEDVSDLTDDLEALKITGPVEHQTDHADL